MNLLYDYLLSTHGQRVAKLSVNAGLGCPNRQGQNHKGCIFCSETGSGEFAGQVKRSITDQMEMQRCWLSGRRTARKYIAYFQSFTNTYGAVSALRKLYEEALAFPDVVGLAVATRADCLPAEVVDLLMEFHHKTNLWIEIGLQTSNDSTAERIRRGYSLAVFDDAVERLHNRGIKVVAHVIFGLPWENRKEMLTTIEHIADMRLWGIKIHSLYIQQDSQLLPWYMKEPFPLLSKEEYVHLVCDAIELLPPSTVVHRLTGDGKKDLLHGPLWACDKLQVIGAIHKEMKQRDSYQGIRFRGDDACLANG